MILFQKKEVIVLAKTKRGVGVGKSSPLIL